MSLLEDGRGLLPENVSKSTSSRCIPETTRGGFLSAQGPRQPRPITSSHITLSHPRFASIRGGARCVRPGPSRSSAQPNLPIWSKGSTRVQSQEGSQPRFHTAPLNIQAGGTVPWLHSDIIGATQPTDCPVLARHPLWRASPVPPPLRSVDRKPFEGHQSTLINPFFSRLQLARIGFPNLRQVWRELDEWSAVDRCLCSKSPRPGPSAASAVGGLVAACRHSACRSAQLPNETTTTIKLQLFPSIDCLALPKTFHQAVTDLRRHHGASPTPCARPRGAVALVRHLGIHQLLVRRHD